MSDQYLAINRRCPWNVGNVFKSIDVNKNFILLEFRCNGSKKLKKIEHRQLI